MGTITIIVGRSGQIQIAAIPFILLLSFVIIHVPGALVAAQNCPDHPPAPIVACYYASWGVYRPGNGTFQIEFIDPTLCTHLIYSFAGLNLNGDIDLLDPHNDLTLGGLKRFVALKDKNPCLKILLAIGGWNEGSERYSLMAESATSRQRFADSVLRLLCHFGFDGLDLDWEYPTQRGGIAADKENLVELLRCLRATFHSRGKLLTVAIGITPWIIETAYAVREMCDTVDLVMLMGYDWQDPTRISVHAPLRREAGEERTTIDDGVRLLRDLSCAPEKIVLGIAAYGRSYTMRTVHGHQIGDEVAGLGKAGPYLREAGALGFNEICEGFAVSGSKWTVERLQENAMSYAYWHTQWVSYEDGESVAIKANYVLEEGLGGMMMYSVDTDDFQGDCLGQTYPLLRAINKGLRRM